MFDIKRIYRAYEYSKNGLCWAFTNEKSFRDDCYIFIIGNILAPFFADTIFQWLMLTGVLVIIIIVEIFNTAIEKTIDSIILKPNKLAGIAKDLGSAAVFISLCFAIFIWLSVIFLM